MRAINPHTREHSRQRSVTVRWLCMTLLITASCSGGGDASHPTTPTTPVTPVTPTVQPGPPALILVQAGDAQTSEPGRAVAIKPTVTVKDAAGVLVPGATVSFVVDSGGGTISGATVTTSIDGSATLGAWTLGKDPARNILRVTAGSAPSVRIVVTTSWAGVTASIGSVGVGGGTISLARPGSLLDGLALIIPANAFTTTTNFSATVAASNNVVAISTANTPMVGRLNATPSLPAAMLAVTPIITINSDGPPNAAQDVLIKLPIPRGTSSNIVVVIVDVDAKPIGYLSPVAMDTNSVTVNLRGLDASVYRVERPVDTRGSRSLSLVVFAGGDALTFKQLYPDAVSSIFQPARDSWGVYDFSTSYYEKMSAGYVMSEWIALGRYGNGGIFGTGSWAAGVYDSRSSLFMMAAIMSEYTAQYYYNSNNLPSWAAYRSGNPANYDRWVLTAALAYLRFGATLPLVLTNGTDSRMVLVCAWNPATESLMVLDHSAPGYLVPLAFQNGRMLPYTDPWTPSIQYTTPISAIASASSMSNALWDGLIKLSQPDEPYVGVWKQTSLYSWGNQLITGSNRTRPDTLFMVDDTTRVWATVQNPTVPISSALPTPTGFGVQKASLYVRDGTVWNPTTIASAATSMFIDARPSVNPDKWFAKTWGFAVISPRTTLPNAYAWQAWRQLDVVKFALKVNGNGTPAILTPITYTVASNGGPAIPANALYEWNYNDGTAITRTAGGLSNTHTFTTAGTKTIDIKLYHPATQQLIAKTTVTVAASGGFAAWKITNIGVQSVATGPSPFGLGTGLPFSWNYYNTIFNNIKSGVEEGGFIYIPRDTTFAGDFHQRGLYAVDGTTFSPAILNTNFDLNSEGILLSLRPGYVRGVMTAYALPQYRAALDPTLSESYAETGTLTSGTIAGTSWEWLSLINRIGGGFNYFPWFTRSANVTFVGATLAGTLTFVVRNFAVPEFTGAETSRYTLTVTFSAIRIQ